jgi:hypothetical protein
MLTGRRDIYVCSSAYRLGRRPKHKHAPLIKRFDNERGSIFGPNVKMKVTFDLQLFEDDQRSTSGVRNFRFGPDEHYYVLSLLVGKIPVSLIGSGVEAKITITRSGRMTVTSSQVVRFFVPEDPDYCSLCVISA